MDERLVPIRLAYVINSLEAGGAQYPIPRIVEGLKAHGIETTVYALSKRDGRATKRLDEHNIKWERAPFPKTAHLKASYWLQSKFEKDRPDVIWTSLTQATLIGQRLGSRLNIPVVSWQHNAFLKPINRFLLKRQRKLSEFWIADSQSVQDFAVRNIKLSENDFRILPLYVAPTDQPQAEAPGGPPFRWLSVGRLHPNKNYAALINALSILSSRSDWTLSIAGDGGERDTLERIIAERNLGSHITLHGHRDDIPEFLANGHGYIQPSRNEGLCISAHEAMTAGLPCLVTDTGQMPRTLAGSLSVVAVGDMDAIVSRMVQIMDNGALRNELSQLSRQRVLETFGPKRFDDALAAIASEFHELMCANVVDAGGFASP